MQMNALPFAAAAVLALATAVPTEAQTSSSIAARVSAPSTEAGTEATGAELITLLAENRFAADLAAMEEFRPGYAFWQHIFRIPDGSVAFGSATDGRLLAVFPARGDWSTTGAWDDPSLSPLIARARLPRRIDDRRDRVAELLEPKAGPIVHNLTRGLFVEPNEERYGRFIEEWSRIYERFGVPPELGLAQGLVESGLNGTVRSEARAIGFCQWLLRNWNVLKRISPSVIEGYNQTTQAPYCAAYLTVLATKYDSFIPALSEHHTGGTNVGRTINNGQWLGGADVREQYFLGSAFSRDIRALTPRTYEDVYGTYGPRSYFYSEMVFGNMANIRRIMEEQKQVTIHAMRTTRNVPIAEVRRRTRMSTDDIQRYNPALIRQVPRGATLYLPEQIDAFGSDVAFWHRPAPQAFTDVLSDFLTIEHNPEDWDDGSIVPVLERFRQRFRRTECEEGSVMATVIAYVVQEIETSGRGDILEEFRTSPRVRALFDRAVDELDAAQAATR